MAKDIFCKMIDGEIPTEKIMETKDWFAIHDINPNAPVHVLIVPEKHGSLQEYTENDIDLLGKLLIGANELARKLGLDKTGYRLHINHGDDSQAHVLDHVHIHMLGGKKLGTSLVKQD